MPSEVRPQLLPSPPPLHDRENHVAFKPLDTAEDELGDSKGFSQVPEFLSCWEGGRGRGLEGWPRRGAPRRLEAHIPPAACGRVISPGKRPPASQRGRGLSPRQQRSAEVVAVTADLRLLREFQSCLTELSDVCFPRVP